jgi:two-component system nitrogen regulation response regulator NtrX
MEKRKSILIVDDNDTLREMLRHALVSSGYTVKTACNGLSGLEKLEKDSCDLLITDNHMPRMGGLELIEEISQREMDIKILMISGDLTREVVKMAKERGVFKCLAKPFSLNLMMETVKKSLEEEKVSKKEYDFYQPPQLLEATAS